MKLLIYVFETGNGWRGFTKTPEGTVTSPLCTGVDPVRYYFIGKLSSKAKREWGYSCIEFVFEEPNGSSDYEVPDNTPKKESVVVVRSKDKETKRTKAVPVPLSKQVDLPMETSTPKTVVGEKEEYLYKRQGNKLVIYQKVLVEKFKLA